MNLLGLISNLSISYTAKQREAAGGYSIEIRAGLRAVRMEDGLVAQVVRAHA
jgi:hypothetical protein